MALQFRRGTAAERSASSVVPEIGEPWFTYDDGQLYVGDGVTAGGVNVGSNVDLEALDNVTTIRESVHTITHYEISSNVVAVTVSLNHNYYEGLIVDISDSSVTALNGSHTVTGISGLTTFTFSLIAPNVSSTATNGTVTPQIPEGSALIWNQTDSVWEDQLIARSINDLTDVDLQIITPTDGDGLVYDSASGNWIPGAVSGNLSDLGDVDLATSPPADGEALVYDDATSTWVPGAAGGNLGDLGDVDLTTTAPADGEALVYDDATSTWIPSAVSAGGTTTTSTSFYFLGGTPPTSVITNSDTLGQNFGTWTEVTFANKIPGYSGPNSAAGDPTLTGITFNGTTGQFENIPQGRYLMSGDISVVVDNPTPAFLTAPPGLIAIPVAISGAGSYAPAGGIPLLPYTSYGSTAASLASSFSFNAVLEDSNPANNSIIIFLDQDQGPTYYIEYATLSIVRYGDL